MVSVRAQERRLIDTQLAHRTDPAGIIDERGAGVEPPRS